MAKQKKGLTVSLVDALVTHVNVTAVAQEDGDAAMHDTVKVLVTLSAERLSEVLQAMGISKSKFMANGPDEVPEVKVVSKYEGHAVKLSGGFGGDNITAHVEDATILDFKIERLSSTAYNLTFKFKGIPTPEHHVTLENAWLDSLQGVMWDLDIQPPAQGDLELESSTSGAEEEGVT